MEQDFTFLLRQQFGRFRLVADHPRGIELIRPLHELNHARNVRGRRPPIGDLQLQTVDKLAKRRCRSRGGVPLLLLLHHHRTLAVYIGGRRNVQRPEMINGPLEGVAGGRKLEHQHSWKNRRHLCALERIVIDENKGTRIQLPLRRKLGDARRFQIP